MAVLIETNNKNTTDPLIITRINLKELEWHKLLEFFLSFLKAILQNKKCTVYKKLNI